MPSKSQSRSSSPKTPRSSTSPSARRPKLMRASATEPSLATSNACRKDLASLQSSRAAALLTRVASYSTAYELAHRAEERCESACSSGQGSPDSVERMERKDWGVQQSGNYFCFPSFEDFQEYHQENQRGEHGVD